MSLLSPNFDVKSVIFPNFGQGPFPKIAGKSPVFSYSGFLTHYIVHSGAYCNGRVRCPWHGACFNVKTGDIEDYPGLDSIQTFKVQ